MNDAAGMSFKDEFPYAADIPFGDAVAAVSALLEKVK